MSHPTSLRLPQPVKRRLDQRAVVEDVSASAIAVRLIDEGLRIADHPGVIFHDSPAYGRVAALQSGPDVAEIVNVLTGLEAVGTARLVETAQWFGIHITQVRGALGYYSAFREEIDAQIAARVREAEHLRRRHEAERALLW